ncbi:MAG TPA: hypothetical protein VKB88_27470 [Bryobacteraceae bacterium]|nr:hypothetical protein [Bryobacteraceae bacterium]
MRRRCSVSVRGKDGWIHSLDTNAESLPEAAYAGIREWNSLWWYDPDAVIEVRAGVECWRASGRRTSEQYLQKPPGVAPFRGHD